jgi:uncharacterized protein (TIGR03435 family)
VKLSAPALWIIAALTSAAGAQHTGDIPPPLIWDKLKGSCQASLDWANLRGKVVVVSFSPDEVFPNDIDNWTEAARNYQGDHVSFIQIVGGSEFLLDQALKQTAYSGCVLFDHAHRNLENFKLPPLGGTVAVDQWGFIAGPAETPPQPQPYNPSAGLTAGIHVSPAQQGTLRSLGAGGPGRYVSKNQPLKLIILDLWDTPLARIVFPERLAEGNYDVTADMPGLDREPLLQLVREAVERRFGLLVQREERTEKIYMLTARHSPSTQLQPAATGEKWMCGAGEASIIGTAQTMEGIARAFEGLLDVPVVDATGLKGTYNYSASSKLSRSEAAVDLAHQLGLELTEAEQPIEMLVVRNVQ